MFTEELTAIRSAEIQAEQIIRDSKSESRNMIEQAEHDASYLISDAEVTAKEKYDLLVSKGLEQAQQEYESAICSAQIEAESLCFAAKSKIGSVADYIVERIVKNSVNS